MPDKTILPEPEPVPEPVKVKPPLPENTPERVAEPEVGVWMVPPLLVTEMGTDEVSPLAKVTVPPVRTGVLAPKLLRETDEPEPTVVVVGLDVTVMLTVAVAAA